MVDLERHEGQAADQQEPGQHSPLNGRGPRRDVAVEPHFERQLIGNGHHQQVSQYDECAAEAA
jgi:hypothetical protein